MKRHGIYYILSMLLLAGYMAGHCWLTLIQPYLETRSIIDGLKSDNPQIVHSTLWRIKGWADDPDLDPHKKVKWYPNHHRWSTHAALRIEHEILDILPHKTDTYTLRQFIRVLESKGTGGTSQSGLDFGKYGDEKWAIIRAAVDHYNRAVTNAGNGPRFRIERMYGINYIKQIIE